MASAKTSPAPSGAATDPRIGRTRSAVHDAGLAILFEDGTSAVTHAALAAATGLSRTTLYKHWPTRVDLLVDICDQIEQNVPPPLTGDARADLLVMVDEMRQTLEEPRVLRVFSEMLAQAQTDPEALELSNALTGSGIERIGDLLAAAAASGDLPDGIDPVATSARLLGPLLFGALVTNRPTPPAEVVSIVDDWLATVRS